MQPPRSASAAARRAADAHRADQVDVDDVGEHLRVVLLAAADHAGAVDEHVEPRQRVDDAP